MRDDRRASEISFARAVLEERAARLAVEFSKLKHRPGQESVHDTRVASRRMRAALEAFRDLAQGKVWDETYTRVRFLTRALGRAREAEVVAALASEVVGGGDAAENVSREYLEERFRREHRKRERIMRDEVAKLGVRQLRRQLGSLTAALGAAGGRFRSPAKKAARPPAAEPDSARLARAIGRLADPILSFPVRKGFARASDDRLHGLRIADKRLRYALEIFDPAWAGGLERQIELARRLQDAAGTHQDWAVLRDRLRREIRRLTKHETSHLAFQIGRLLARVEEHKVSARNAILEPLVELQQALRDTFNPSAAGGEDR